MKDNHHYIAITETGYDKKRKENYAIFVDHDQDIKKLIGKVMSKNIGSFKVYKEIDWAVSEKGV